MGSEGSKRATSIELKQLTESNIDEVCDASEYNAWLQQRPVMEDNKSFNDLTFKVQVYCYVMISGYLLGLFIAHLIPILHLFNPNILLWGTCRLYSNPATITWTCVAFWHVIDAVPILGVMIMCIITLKYWSYSFVETFQNHLLPWCTIATWFNVAYEAVLIWQALLRENPTYQTYPLIFLSWLLAFGILFGWYTEYQIYLYLRITKHYEVKHPKTESEIVSIVKKAYINHGKVRVVGSKHSTTNSIYVDDVYSINQTMISLDLYTGVKILKIKKRNDSYELKNEEDEKDSDLYEYRATVKGGTCMGLNRDNPLSSESNGLVYILEKEGFSLPDIGGIVQQTVAGFTSTGCGGGSIYNDYYDSIYSVRIIDGRGDIKTYYKPSSDPKCNDPYWGVIVSMGLMGIISEITFNLKPNYIVLGSQICLTAKDWLKIKNDEDDRLENQDGDNTGNFNLFSLNNDDRNSLYQLIMNEDNKHKAEYIRLFVWPQDLDNIFITIWKGHKERKDIDYKFKEWAQNYKHVHNGDFENVYYHEFSNGEKGILQQKILSLLFNTFGSSINTSTKQLPEWMVNMVQYLVKEFNETPGEQYFGADWSRILPMDQEIYTDLLPIQFTELFIDIEDTSKVLKLIHEYWASQNNVGLKNTGLFAWEFYPAKPCNEWLRMSYKQYSLRIDILWFDIKTNIPYNFFTPFWNLLIKNNINFRPHWAKWFPGGNVKFPNDKYKIWSDYYSVQYPKWKQWHELRKKMDPNNIFVNKYWSQTLNINDDAKLNININNNNNNLDNNVISDDDQQPLLN